MGIARADLIQGLAKGLGVLEAFDTERQRLNITLTAQRAGITRAAARRCLLTLHHLGYLESRNGHYWLAPKVLRFSGSYLATARLPRAMQPWLDRLAVRSGEGFSCVVLDAGETVIVARGSAAGPAVGGRHRLIARGLHLGARLPAHATSTGRVLLATLSSRALVQWLATHPLRPVTTRTITRPGALRDSLVQVRKQGFCIAVEEHEPGVAALAVPLRDAAGRVVAALNVVVAARRFTAAALQRRFLPLLREAAHEVDGLL